MTKQEYEQYIAEQKIRQEKGYLTRSERTKLVEMIANPKNYIKDTPITTKKGKIIVTDITILKKPCIAVTPEDKIDEIIAELKTTLAEQKCLGLTANQIGYDKAISYIKIPKINEEKKMVEFSEIILINPKIIEKERPIRVNNESCVSFPGISVNTNRYTFVTVSYLNDKFEEQTMLASDLEAITLQHEIDHCHGLTIFSRKYNAK